MISEDSMEITTPAQITSAPVFPNPIKKFKPDIYDFIFAIAAFALGYLFSRWVLFSWEGWGVFLFTTLYLLSATAYLMRRNAFSASIETWFWLVITWLTGVSYALWQNEGFAVIRGVFLFCSAAYYILVASGRLSMGKTSNFLPLDGINAVIILPFINFLNQYLSFTVLKRKDGKRSKLPPILIGSVIAVVLMAILIPLLQRADSGGFGRILASFSAFFRYFLPAEYLLYCIPAVPVAGYLYGLVSGAAHDIGSDSTKPERVKRAVASMRILQPPSVFIVLGAVCSLYLLFILSQLPYFFSAFSGIRPEGWLVYADYARQGFFELSGIAALNLTIITACNIVCKKTRSESVVLRVFNIALAIITMVLIVTAFSKMALYIGAYGLTMPRLLPCVFMVFLAAVFIALIVLQKWNFSIVRFALITGAVILCALSLANPDAIVVRYNSAAFMSGSLNDYDSDVLYRSGAAGVLPAIEVYEWTDDEAIKKEISAYLNFQRELSQSQRSHEISFESHRLGFRG